MRRRFSSRISARAWSTVLPEQGGSKSSGRRAGRGVDRRGYRDDLPRPSASFSKTPFTSGRKSRRSISAHALRRTDASFSSCGGQSRACLRRRKGGGASRWSPRGAAAMGSGLFHARRILAAHTATLDIRPRSGGRAAHDAHLACRSLPADDALLRVTRSSSSTTSGRSSSRWRRCSRATATSRNSRTLRAAGLALMRKVKPDLVLLDLGLPDADGLDVLREVEARVPQMPVIILTANDSLNNAIESIKQGAFHFISKPYAVEELLSLICARPRAAAARARDGDAARGKAAAFAAPGKSGAAARAGHQEPLDAGCRRNWSSASRRRDANVLAARRERRRQGSDGQSDPPPEQARAAVRW